MKYTTLGLFIVVKASRILFVISKSFHGRNLSIHKRMMDTTYISGLKTKPLITQIAVIFKILNYLYHLKAQLMSCFTTEHHKCTYIHRYMFVSMYVGTCSWSVHELTTDHALTYLITCGITICKYDWVIFSRMDPFQYKHGSLRISDDNGNDIFCLYVFQKKK
jgi:hypothetical protein